MEGTKTELQMIKMSEIQSQQKMNSQADRDLVNAFLAEVEETA